MINMPMDWNYMRVKIKNKVPWSHHWNDERVVIVKKHFPYGESDWVYHQKAYWGCKPKNIHLQYAASLLWGLDMNEIRVEIFRERMLPDAPITSFYGMMTIYIVHARLDD